MSSEDSGRGAIIAQPDEVFVPGCRGSFLQRLSARALAFDAPGASGRWLLTALLAAALLAIVMIPTHWDGNEINYFDLSLRFVRPESMTPLYAAYDASNARFLSFTILGFFIDHLGFETAHVVLGVVMAGVLGLAFAFMAGAIGISRVESLAALALFLALRQKLFVHEWIFGGVEAKAFAYAAIFFAIGFAWKGWNLRAVALAALATYFHFLVGGFWGAAILLLIGIRAGSLRKPVVPFLVFATLVLPMFVLLLREQMMGADIASVPSDLTANQIYSQVRNFRLVAPFLTPQIFLRNWLGGIVATAALVAGMVYLMRRTRPDSTHLGFWLFTLNGYLGVAMIAAFFDRHDAFLGPFYIFRPAALTLLLSLMATLHWVRLTIGDAERQRRYVLALCVAMVAFGMIGGGVTAYHLVRGAKLPIANSLKSPQREMVTWIREHTPPESVVLVGPWPKNRELERRMPWVAFEHLFGRPTLVNFKFVPTRKDQILAWYQLLLWRDAVFAGDCDRLAEQPVDYVAVLAPEAVGRLSGCGREVWTNGAYTVLKTGRGD